jgi:hypothetical protein
VKRECPEESTHKGGKGKVKKVQIVLKWGGELSSYCHDVKTYASDEGRFIKTAAVFIKVFLSI